jgi:transposase-like protein
MSGKRRVYSVELKLRTLARMRAGEPASRLAAEIGVLPGKLYEWRAAYRKNEGGFRRRGRPSLIDAVEAGAVIDDDLASARRAIAELQRKVGEQSQVIDFFKGALRRIEASRQAKDAPGGTASSPRSKR